MQRRAVLLALALGTPASMLAQEPVPPARRDSVVELPAMTVTATRQPRELFNTPAPVTVVDSTALARRAAGTLTDLFVDQPGVDLNGVGPSQSRLVIRGQLGQRILLLEDGIRMNNSRRQQDFGEIPAIVALEALGSVEVVRGPASVLYGTDAIGGAVNLITRQPPRALNGTSVHGSFGYRYQDAGGQQHPWGLLNGTAGRFNWMVFGSYRDAGSYDAPAGSFGGLTLGRDTRVRQTGVEDGNLMFQTGYAFSPTQSVFGRYERYSANDAGFGYVPNDRVQPFDSAAPTIAITYPTHYVDKVSTGYSARGLGFVLADRLDVTGYYMTNNRTLNLDIFVPFVGPGLPPGAGLVSTTRNYTSLATWGMRVEAAKAIGGRHLLTYGVDGFRDRSNNTDLIVQTIVGFGPPAPDTSTTPQLPNAIFRSLGGFAQIELRPAERLNVIAGARVQDIRAETRATPGITAAPVSDGDRTVVGTLNLGYSLTENLTLIGTVGRGFRAPNLVERFFTGPTPEGSGYQKQTPGLRPETSLNFDLGFRYRGRGVNLEVFGFRNEIHDGVAIRATGDTVQGLEEFENVNLDKLRYLGLEASGSVTLGHGFSTGANFTVFDSKDVLDPSNPVGQTYGLRLGGTVRYDAPQGRFWLAYDVRHNGEERDISIASAVGTPVPGFTVHDARVGARLFQAGPTRHTAGLTVANIGNRLYSEASNTSFFRPAPGRSVVLTYRVDF